MDPFLCFPFWNLMCFGGPKNLMFFDGPFPSWNLMCFDGPKNLMCFDGPTCVPPLRKPHVFWWTQKPHVFWWTLYLMWFDGPFRSIKTHECQLFRCVKVLMPFLNVGAKIFSSNSKVLWSPWIHWFTKPVRFYSSKYHNLTTSHFSTGWVFENQCGSRKEDL